MNKKLLMFAGAVVVLSISIFALTFMYGTKEISKYVPRENRDARNVYNKPEHGIAGAIAYYNERKKNVKTGKVELSDMVGTQLAVADFEKSKSKTAGLGLTWKEMGPDNVGGRTRAILYDKNYSNKMYAGGVSGGLWRSFNGGVTWVPYDDQMRNICVSSITQNANGIIYIGTGEVFTGFIGGQGTISTPGFIGKGIFKSTDSSGDEFVQLTSTFPSDTNNSVEWALVNRLASDPSNTNRIYAAMNKGLRVSNEIGRASCRERV